MKDSRTGIGRNTYLVDLLRVSIGSWGAHLAPWRHHALNLRRGRRRQPKRKGPKTRRGFLSLQPTLGEQRHASNLWPRRIWLALACEETREGMAVQRLAVSNGTHARIRATHWTSCCSCLRTDTAMARQERPTRHDKEPTAAHRDNYACSAQARPADRVSIQEPSFRCRLLSVW